MADQQDPRNDDKKIVNMSDSERDEDEFLPRRELLDQIDEAIEAEDTKRLNALLEPMHAADIADIIEQLHGSERTEFLQLYSDRIDGEILSEIDEAIREEVLEFLPRDVLADAVREMDSDDVVDLIEDLDEPERAEILAALDDSDRAAVQQSLAYPEHSAGRLMHRRPSPRPNIGRWARRSTSCAPRTGCPNSSITSFWSIRAAIRSATWPWAACWHRDARFR